MQRRLFLTSIVALAAAAPIRAETFEITLTDAQWRARLSAAQYAVLREEDTEPAFSSSLNDEHRAGVFLCAGCDLPLYASEAKYDSGTGWPSFFQPIPGSITLHEDNSHGMHRIEVRSASSGIHLGHVFDDGPAPTGKRYCINGNVLKFVPDR